MALDDELLVDSRRPAVASQCGDVRVRRRDGDGLQRALDNVDFLNVNPADGILLETTRLTEGIDVLLISGKHLVFAFKPGVNSGKTPT